ncbi:MAG TPA: DNA double-strand break repair nuclease NurA [Candidatus Bilamarchaeum sp.]|nr:DNA double-strand break repair nuclease NurA [Candidatus Bilamarchaeum sp.]
MDERLSSLARQMLNKQSALGEKAKAVRSADPTLVLKVQKIPLGLSVCAVDGGLLYERMHGADIILCRAVGVIFSYSGSKLSSHKYFPSKIPEPELELRDSLDEHDALVFRSLIRLKHELSMANSILSAEKADVLLIDGSLLPLPSDRPGEGSGLSGLYGEVIGLYEALFAKAKQKDCLLFGVIKDSRSKKLARSAGLECADTLLCEHLLSAGERTRDFPYYDEKPAKDLAHLAGMVRVFYLRPSKDDSPLRVELLDTGDVSGAASVLCTLCAISDAFAYPAALIEADMCAALDPAYLEAVESALASLSGLRPLRRNSRPFR